MGLRFISSCLPFFPLYLKPYSFGMSRPGVQLVCECGDPEARSCDNFESVDELFRCLTSFVMPWHFTTNLSSAINSCLNGTYIIQKIWFYFQKVYEVLNKKTQGRRLHLPFTESSNLNIFAGTSVSGNIKLKNKIGNCYGHKHAVLK